MVVMGGFIDRLGSSLNENDYFLVKSFPSQSKGASLCMLFCVLLAWGAKIILFYLFLICELQRWFANNFCGFNLLLLCKCFDSLLCLGSEYCPCWLFIWW